MSLTLQRARETVRGRSLRVVFPEWDADPIREARGILTREDLCVPIPVAETSQAQRAAVLANRDLPPERADRLLGKPLIRAAAMVGAGEADAVIAGVATPTRRVIEAAGFGIGPEREGHTPSSFFLMVFPGGREVIFADCALVVDPDAETLAHIAQSTARSAERLFGEALAALLSYSTGTSGQGPSVEKVRKAAELSGLPGPVQGDAALNSVIASKKGITTAPANALIFPALDAGNIAYKLAQELAGAQAIGPILQGFRKPVCDLSRGASADDIVAATVLTLAMIEP